MTYLAAAAIVVVLVAAVGVVVADLARLRTRAATPSAPTTTATPLAVAPSPSLVEAAPSASASAGVVVVLLTSEVSAGAPPVQVAVLDQSGRLTGATEKGAVDPTTFSFDGRFGAYAEPGTPGRIHLVWIGGICDSRITVTVAAAVRSITFDMGPPVDCDSAGVGRELVLDFDGSVDVPAVALSDVVDPAGPTAGPGDYALECGSLGPDTCQEMATEIVAVNEQGSPGKRVVSITFFDDCGSYTVIFDDGSGLTGDFDCAPP